MEIPSFSQRTGLGPVYKSYRSMVLRNGISLGIRKKHIRIGNKFDCVEGVIFGKKLQWIFFGISKIAILAVKSPYSETTWFMF